MTGHVRDLCPHHGQLDVKRALLEDSREVLSTNNSVKGQDYSLQPHVNGKLMAKLLPGAILQS